MKNNRFGLCAVLGAAIVVVTPLAATAEPSAHTAAPRTWAMTQVETAVPGLARQQGFGSELSLWYVDQGVLHVGLTKFSTAQAGALRQRFGSNTVVFRQSRFTFADKRTPITKGLKTVHVVAVKPGGTAGRASAKSASPAVQTANKLSDTLPYYGGDRILSKQGNYIIQCTANFKAVETTGSKSAAAITAGHCGPTGTKWQQAYLSGNTIHSTGNYGTDAKGNFNSKGDQELLTGSSWAYSAWTTYNPGGNSGNVIEYYARGVAKGAHICSDGSYTNYTCGGTVTAVKACANEDENGTLHYVCGLDTATATHRLVQSGDSGGPVWDQASPATKAINAGIISAGSADGKTLLFEDIITAAHDLQFTEPIQR